MDIERFIWLPSVVDKILGKHNVSPEEVEEIFYNKPMVRFHERGRVQGENMYTVFGQTDGDRYLTVFYILKQHRQALVISARDMSSIERKRYGRKKQQ